tara:strand:+ start:751 stop:1668 length:918 start_codon:yes stop_codon:yes gene_type:complete
MNFSEYLNTLKEGKKKRPGLWANIHAKRKRGGKPAKPGDENYPETLNIEAKKTRCWKGYEPTPGKKAFTAGSCRKVDESLPLRRKLSPKGPPPRPTDRRPTDRRPERPDAIPPRPTDRIPPRPTDRKPERPKRPEPPGPPGKPEPPRKPLMKKPMMKEASTPKYMTKPPFPSIRPNESAKDKEIRDRMKAREEREAGLSDLIASREAERKKMMKESSKSRLRRLIKSRRTSQKVKNKAREDLVKKLKSQESRGMKTAENPSTDLNTATRAADGAIDAKKERKAHEKFPPAKDRKVKSNFPPLPKP